jgi:O-antigen/teichoic acid export membrane protein
VIANFVGQLWSALVGIAFLPLYVNYIGVEAYGIIGFFVMLQALYSLLDMGMSATLSREMAMGAAKSRVFSVLSVLRTIEWIYIPIGPLIGILTWSLSDWVALSWLRSAAMSSQDVATAITLLGLSAALQWPASLYSAGLIGVQRQVLLNVLRIGISTISSFGCLFLLMHSPVLSTYLYWQIGMSALQSVVFALALYKVLPEGAGPGKFSWLELHRIRGFASGVMGVTLLSLALTQADRFILSRTLALDQFGYYALASSLAAVVYRIVQPISLAYGPRYAQLVAESKQFELSRQYHFSSQMVAILLGPVMAISIFFGHDILLLWSRDQVLANQVAPVFSLLVVAWSLHGLMNLPYALQLAYGWTTLSFAINLGSLVFVLPVFWILGGKYGGLGVAAGWLVLTSIYVLLGPFLMHKRYLKGEVVQWYCQDIGPALIACNITAAILAAWIGALPQGIEGWLLLMIVAGVVFVAGLVVSRQVGPMAWKVFKTIY